MDTAPSLNQGRYYELDSLRGLAALTVMIHHILLVLPVFALPYMAPMPDLVRLIRFSPLGVIMAGREAVIFFFVLSGFVLALPFLKQGKVLPYRPYVIKRVCRIYPPYLIAVGFAILMNALCYRGTVAGLSEWFMTFWQPQIDGRAALAHLPLINSFPSNKFDPVVWSLIMEMRLSLLFPLIMYGVLKFGWRTSLLGESCAASSAGDFIS
jgi:peptidoglycan/LPS O-acetylase OafA/YrhL